VNAAVVQYWRWVIRREARRIVAVAVLLGLTVGLAGAAFVGARRSATAFDRLEAATQNSDVLVAVYAEDVPGVSEALDAMRRTTDVVEVAQDRVLMARPAGSGLMPVENVTVAASMDPDRPEINRPLMIEGRAPAPGAKDEIFVTRSARDELGLRVGDTVALETMSPGGAAAFFSGGAPSFSGPTIETTIVGIALEPGLFQASNPSLELPYAVIEPWVDEIGFIGDVHLVRVTEGADREVVSARIKALDPRLLTSTSTWQRANVQEALRVIAASLSAAGTAILVVLVGLVLAVVARVVDRAAVHHDVLHALGIDARGRRATLLLVAAPIVAIGAALAVVVSWALSPLAVFGLAARMEPVTPRTFDGVVAVGLVGLTAVTVGAVVLVRARAFMAAREVVDERSKRRRGRERAPTAMITAHWLRGGRRHRWLLVSGAASIMLGTLGVGAAATVGASLDELLATPSLFGRDYQVEAVYFSGPEDAEATGLDTVLADRSVVSSTVAVRHLVTIAGGSSVILLADGALVHTRGEPADDADEIVLDVSTARARGISVGDSVEIAGSAGSAQVRVVGLSVVSTAQSSPADAIAPTSATYVDHGAGVETSAFLQLVPGSDATQVIERLKDHANDVRASDDLLPPRLVNLDDASPAILAVGAFAAVLSAGAVIGSTAAIARRRSGDLVAYRAVGATSRDVRAVLARFSLVFALVPSGLGVILGAGAGWVAWSALTLRLGVGTSFAPAAPVIAATLLLVCVIGQLAPLRPWTTTASIPDLKEHLRAE
jgi:ABC-type antimicrobial peptide transport system permease subunit